MVLTRAQTIESIEQGPRWTAVTFAEQRLLQLTTDTAALVYLASATRDAASAPYSARVSSVYVHRRGEWRLALHQQSPQQS
jgi:hypothetical protein